MVIRNLYLYKRSIPRLMDLFYWPIMDLLLWGFLSLYLMSIKMSGFNIMTVLLGALIFWDLFAQSQRAVSISFLEEIWERNLLNIFVTPLTVKEFLASTIFLGLIRIILVGIVISVLALALYAFNILLFGLFLVPFIINLLIFGWIVGLFTIGLILRFGTSAQVFAFGLIFLIQPLSAVFYPVSALPPVIQTISYAIPTTHVFEGMRAVIATGTLPITTLALALITNFILLALVIWFIYAMFNRVKQKGMLMKLD